MGAVEEFCGAFVDDAADVFGGGDAAEVGGLFPAVACLFGGSDEDLDGFLAGLDAGVGGACEWCGCHDFVDGGSEVVGFWDDFDVIHCLLLFRFDLTHRLRLGGGLLGAGRCRAGERLLRT